MALASLTVRPSMTKGIGPLVRNTWKGDNSTTYYAGQLLRKLTNGTMVPVAVGAAWTDGAPVTTVGIHAIYAGATRTAATADFIPIREITTATRFECQLWHATEASAIQAQASIGDFHELVFGTNTWGVDMEENTTPDVEITNIWDNIFDYASSYDESGVYGIVEVKILEQRINALPDAS